MSSADNVFYQSAKGGLAMRLNNAEQLAQGREGILSGLQAQQLTLDDDVEHAKTNRDTAIFGISLGGGGAYKVAYGIGKAVGGKYLSRATSRLQTAVDQYRRQTANQPEGTPEEVGEPTPEVRPADAPFRGGIDPIAPREDFEGFGRQAGTDIETPAIRVTDEPAGGTVEDAYGEEFDPKTLDMSDPQNPKPFPDDQIPKEFPQSATVAKDGFGNEFDPRYVDTSSYRNPQAVPEDRLYGENIEEAGFEEEPIPKLPPLSQDPSQVIGEATTQEVRAPSSFKVLGQEPDVMNPLEADRAGTAIRSAGRPNVDFLNEAQNNRLNQIRNSDPILSEDNVGDLKKMGLDFGDLDPQEVDSGARMLLGDTAVEGLSSMLGVAGGVVGAALPVLGVVGDLAGLAFAIKGLYDSADAVNKEKEQQANLTQAVAATNIPTQVSKQGSAPVLDTSAMRTGGFQNF
jgi:hypothetical protein